MMESISATTWAAFCKTIGMTAGACVLCIAGSSYAAERTTTSPTWSARRAFQEQLRDETGTLKTGATIHAHQVRWGYLGGGMDKPGKYDAIKTVVWEGALRGPRADGAKGPQDIRIAVVPAAKGLTPREMVGGTKISEDLSSAGAAKVKQHLESKGLQVKTVQLGDYYSSKDAESQRAAQRPMTRENGSLRYTATFADGSQRRFLVPTDAKALIDGKPILGKVVADMDHYRLTPPR